MRIGLIATTSALLVGLSSAMAAVPASIVPVTPGQINYQGRLQAADGTPYADGVYTMEFRLHASPSATNTLWGQEHVTYVKNGHFSVLLGSPAGTPLGGAAHDELWRALWYDAAVPNNEFFFGVTLHQDENNAAIDEADRTEALPRQQLLAVPFAFRAQAAEYARRSDGDFDVGGNLNVAGAAQLAAVQTAGGDVRLGDVAKSDDVSIYGDSVDVFAGAGDLWMQSSDLSDLKGREVYLEATGGKIHLSASSTVSINDNVEMNHNDIREADIIQSGGGAAKIDLDQSGDIRITSDDGVHVKLQGDDLDLYAGDNVAVAADDSIAMTINNFQGNGFDVQVKSGSDVNQRLYADSDDDWNIEADDNIIVACQGFFAKLAAGQTSKRAFVLKSYKSVDSDTHFSTGYSVTEYAAMVVGSDAGYADIEEGRATRQYEALAYPENGKWIVRVQAPTHGNHADWTVHVLFIHKALVEDVRSDWGTSDSP